MYAVPCPRTIVYYGFTKYYGHGPDDGMWLGASVHRKSRRRVDVHVV